MSAFTDEYIHRLMAETQELKQALQFYANEKTYETKSTKIEAPAITWYMDTSPISEDVGEKARYALAKFFGNVIESSSASSEPRS